MPKIRYDVSNVEERSFDLPKPGVYSFKIKEIEQGQAKSSGNDQLRVQLQIVSGEFKGSVLSHYIPLDVDSPGYFRMQEFLKVLGLSRKKGTLDTDKLIGKTVKARVKSDTYEGEYSPKIGNLLPPGEEPDEDDADDGEDLDDEPKPKTRRRRSRQEEPVEDDDDADDDADDDDADDDDAEADDDGDDDGAEAEEDDYDEWSVDELKAELGERGLRTGGKKTVLIGRLRKNDETDEDPFDGS